MRLTPAYSTISADSIAALVNQRYEIAPVANCRLFHRGFNDTYELGGANGRSYMARLSNRRFRGPPNLAYETALLMHLHGAGIVVGVPLADREGRLWTIHDAPEGPRELAVFERLSGRDGLVAAVRRAGKADEQTLADVAALGASLASIHLAAETFEGPPSLYRLEGAMMLDGALTQLAAAFEGGLAEEAGATAAQLKVRLETCAPSLSVGHCHGDNHAGNTLIADAADGTLQ
ncbi:MAG: phosphotransferase enzyme family protein, partial [Caulobacteraceae bacterium]